MHYPRAIHDEIEAINLIVSAWPADVDVKLDDVINWVLQFDTKDFDLALRVIRNVNILGQKDIDRGLRVAFSKLSRKAIEKDTKISGKNTLYAAMGQIGKSGALISYHFRMNTEISEENFLSEETLPLVEEGKVENIVLMDDVIGTGNQATGEIKRITEMLVPLGIKNIFVLTVCGMVEAIRKIETETKAYTFSAFEYSNLDTVSSLDGNFYKGVEHANRESMLSRLESYGKICYNKSPLGFGRTGGLLVMPYNTPNNTIPILWSDDNNWIPLFRRVRRINGIAAYQSQFKKATQKRTREEHVGENHLETKIITILVEGKFDELFFDALSKQEDFAAHLGVNKVNIVGVGGIPSTRFAKTIADTMPSAIFITDTSHPKKNRLGDAKSSGLKIVELYPSVFIVLDVNGVKQFLNSARHESHKLDDETPDEKAYQELEGLLKSAGVEKAKELMSFLVANFLNRTTFGNFMTELRGAGNRNLIEARSDNK